jgi:small subunit ribosomal protein S19
MKKQYSDLYIKKKINKVQRICKEKNIPQTKVLIKLWSRQSTVLTDYVGYAFQIHNGKNYKKLVVSEDMVGKKFGEFAPTRKFITHKKKKAK